MNIINILFKPAWVQWNKENLQCRNRQMRNVACSQSKKGQIADTLFDQQARYCTSNGTCMLNCTAPFPWHPKCPDE